MAVMAACSATMGAAALSATSASASDASIKAAIKAEGPKLTVAEGELLTELGHYRMTGNPAPVQAKLAAVVVILRSLKTNIAAQSAVSTKVKRGKAKFEKGIGDVVIAYERLEIAIGEKKASKAAAKAEVKKAGTAIKKATKELVEGEKLLA
jgi:hypothetical protein